MAEGTKITKEPGSKNNTEKEQEDNNNNIPAEITQTQGTSDENLENTRTLLNSNHDMNSTNSDPETAKMNLVPKFDYKHYPDQKVRKMMRQLW